MKNKYEVRENICYVEVTRVNGDVVTILVDESDALKLKGLRLNVIEFNKKNTPLLYARVSISKNDKRLLHRYLLECTDSTLVVDHINGNALDNRRSNLRVVTKEQNSQNRRGPVPGTSSGIRGVTYDKRRDRWVAVVSSKGKNYYLGRFDSKEEAGKVASSFRRTIFPMSEMDKEE